MWQIHMIGDSRMKNTVSVATLARNRAVPPKARRSLGRVSTSITVAILGANHMTRMIASSAWPASGRMKSAGVGDGGERQRADDEQPDPGRRAQEHQHGEGELEAADELHAGHEQEVAVLQRALAPALVAADEFDQRRRILLPAEVFLRQHAHVVAGAAHQRRLDLVVAQHMAAEHAAFRQFRDVAMRDERRDADDGVVAPVGSAIGLPPGAADGP